MSGIDWKQFTAAAIVIAREMLASAEEPEEYGPWQRHTNSIENIVGLGSVNPTRDDDRTEWYFYDRFY